MKSFSNKKTAEDWFLFKLTGDTSFIHDYVKENNKIREGEKERVF